MSARSPRRKTEVVPKSVLITGTTRGLGLALLEHYVSQGERVIAVNRRRDAALEQRYPSVRFECVDVHDAAGIARLVDELSRTDELPDVFILNAGVNAVDNDRHFDLAAFRTVMDTNLYGVLAFVQPLTLAEPGRSPRHVVAVGSTAGYVGNPYGLGYHTSKRALRACFETLSAMYAGSDLVFQHVALGPIQTAMYTMESKFPGWMIRVRDAFAATPVSAARAIARFAETRRRSLHYPRRSVPLYLGLWLARWLIPGFFRGRRTLEGDARRSAVDAAGEPR